MIFISNSRFSVFFDFKIAFSRDHNSMFDHGCLDMDFIEFRCVLGHSRELLLGQCGRKIVIKIAKIDVGITNLFYKTFQ